MEDSFPPLPGATAPNGLMSGAMGPPAPPGQASGSSSNTKKTRIISPDANFVLDFTAPSSQSQKLAPARYLMGVSSTALKESSAYFRVILDPDKFREGRELFERKAQLDSECGMSELSTDDATALAELPTLSLELPPIGGVSDKADLLEAFLKVLHIGRDKLHGVDAQEFLQQLAKKSISFIANLIVLSDRFDGQQVLSRVLDTPLGGKRDSTGDMMISKALRRLQTPKLEDEDRTRQAIYVALFLGDKEGIMTFTHRLVIDGSKEWVYGGRDGWVGIDRPLWWHLPNGIEEELRFRHQCILDTITDLQSHFLRAYGALPPQPSQQPSQQQPSPMAPPSSASSTTKLQCRRMYENSRSCDSFHLGEIIRFFSTRTKTLHLESSLSYQAPDPDEDEYDEEYPNNIPGNNNPYPDPTPTNIPTLLTSLRQCPEYQIDPNHAGCGLRRRLLPALDCLATFTTNSHSAVGICPIHYDNDNPQQSTTRTPTSARTGSWRNPKFRDKVKVSIGAGKVESVTYLVDGAVNGELAMTCTCVVNAELARIVFTAGRRWNL
ncbi:hypothetical protein AJ79_07315 [Helicocarpus griseus UAMH5409]|uniref:BTB domain-containing protein n=1 Tax=Helicocarpus griseus UAMH5409 TaxID=1447875 RepID=A0A2B7X4B9_9EURO|nr:hypothetical protein AJ79_07315 [Helicocarpus griseus UAMH5409]